MRMILLVTGVILVMLRAGVSAEDKGGPLVPSWLPDSKKAEPARSGDRLVLKGALTLNEAVAVAMKENPHIQMGREQVKAAEARVLLAQSMLQPTMTAYSFATTGDRDMVYGVWPTAGPPGIQTISSRSAFTQNATLMFPLYTGGRLNAEKRGAQWKERAAQAQFRSLQLEVALSTRMAYRQALLAAEVARIYDEQVKSNEERLRIDRLALEAGKIPRYYVLRDEAELANARQMYTDAKRDADSALFKLRTILGVHHSSTFTLSDGLGMAPYEIALEKSLAESLDLRPEMASVRNLTEASRQAVRAAKGAYSPEVNAMAMGNAISPRNDTGMSEYSVGLTMSIPLLDGGKRRAMVLEADAMKREKEREAEALALKIHEEVNTAYVFLESARKNVQTAEAALESAKEEYRVANLRYEAGKGINLEILDALTALVRARTNHARALFEYGNAVDIMERVTGRMPGGE
jgi:outer membrane protein TolC